MSTFALQRVEFMPKILQPNVLYVSQRYQIAGHLCPCGCGVKVMTPLGPAEWSFRENGGRPSLSPSISSGQLPCRSHYFITNGKTEWSIPLSDNQVRAGQNIEERRRQAHYNELRRQNSLWRRFWNWLLGILNAGEKK